MSQTTKKDSPFSSDVQAALLDDSEKQRIRLELGRRVKGLRSSAGMTLEQAAERTGLAVSTIYKIENGKVSPSFENLLRLARGYGVGLEKLIAEPEDEVSTTRLTVTRAGQGRSVEGKVYEYEVLCNGLTGKKIIPLIGTISAAGDSVPAHLDRHDGEELLFVLEGEVELMVEHYEPVLLGAGDCAYYDSTMRHGVRSTGPNEARVFWACTHLGGLS
ncbi:helix-turn-helix domain-containing protein [Tritonibacter mobilis]|uniref:helix-turn-helix domain-containing protein n=1 Tax=Tritonibacter mobilis TaxID=379347 RepID=UPI000806E619|nr:XRE family transcriptional regulator [Tritonibacter mobilis]NHM21231.1 helix-turn-helix domain-containing protein [Tritonibacter mobilis]NHM25388.1 helix-turn-helix domain-containing protein [Tritonibacter mobilis]NKX38635.1 helix-turn-helix domain-containing protein [Rhodobacteraceae bacterium R_SAG5]SDX03574.1 transcriptional regulator, XRE family with cupin sensor [Tritonibacter mobilis]